MFGPGVTFWLSDIEHVSFTVALQFRIGSSEHFLTGVNESTVE